MTVVGLTKTYGSRLTARNVHALNGASFELKRGEICGLVGPNGAGKSTLIKLIMGIEPRNEGRIIFGDENIGIIGYVPERPTFFEDLTAFQNLLYIARLDEMPGAEDLCHKALDRFGLGERKDDLVRTFSKGMKQRLAIARALISSPKLLVMDEPFSGLDPTMVMDLRGHLKGLRGTGLTILVSSHELNEIDQVCDSIVFIKDGRMVKKEGYARDDGYVKLQITVLNPSEDVMAAMSTAKIISADGGTIVIELRRSEVPATMKRIVDAGGQLIESKILQRKAEEMYADVFLRKEAGQ
ncbi:MAG TPA: ABC transporter ATP-binding protein [Methanomassiliicoccales archaeon]|nr:ABC transporter ATP-binding protein [Methanomassiliicoccales archaeon]HNX47874.1 ABC transporter ATP-binding protein [Methanomassiliicoccales archaeon]HPR98946.1 ABC transporter ATP-binding protein [Methanomassiliicoccales archaeon]